MKLAWVHGRGGRGVVQSLATGGRTGARHDENILIPVGEDSQVDHLGGIDAIPGSEAVLLVVRVKVDGAAGAKLENVVWTF